LEYADGPSGPWAPVGTYSFGPEEDLLAASPDGARLYAAESGPGAHQVLVFNTTPGAGTALLSTVSLAGAGAVPVAVAVAPNAAYVLDGTNDRVDVVPVPTPAGAFTATSTFPVGDLGDPAAMALSPGSGQLVVANYGSGTVSIIGTATGTVATVALPGLQPAQPMGVVVAPSGTDAYVVDRDNDQVDEISLAGAGAGTVVATIPVGAQGPSDTPADIDVADSASTGVQVYVGNAGAGTVSAISAATGTVTNIALGGPGGGPVALAAAPNGCFVAALASGAGGSSVSLISTATNAVVSTSAEPGPGTCIAIAGSSNGYQAVDGAVIATPTELSYELQAAQTTAGGGFRSAYSPPITVSLGRGQLP
jgi:DNA-binding beta-propeller fold protein YncE